MSGLDDYLSWGRFPRVSQRVEILNPARLAVPAGGASLLPYGKGRSYGDCCLNAGGLLLSTERLSAVLGFDPQTGTLRCEGGVSLADLLPIIVPAGWFLPVTPGTRHVTVGGAIANDVHGKNHHARGTFGRHVTSICLLRSDGSEVLCGPGENDELFRATIGGIGLTGLIKWAEFKLVRIESPYIQFESIKFGTLDEFFSVSSSSDSGFEHTVAWLDCLHPDGRGIFMRGNFAPREGLPAALTTPAALEAAARFKELLRMRFDAPSQTLSGLSMRLFNALYYGRQFSKTVRKLVPYGGFFYPLDAIGNWNRIYGRRGFFQFQCVLPERDAMKELFKRVAGSGQGSFLAVLKEFGDARSPGLMSFPRRGATLALDFPNRGPGTISLLSGLEDFVREAGGAMYPAKDALMSKLSFSRFYPNLDRFRGSIDPAFSSSFWRRVTE